MTEIKNLTCIGCPLGCALEVTLHDGEVSDVTGNTCKRGDAYARKEVTHPTRVVTSTVAVANGEIPMVSVKTEYDIPKEKMTDIMRALSSVIVSAPVSIGDIILENAAETGVNVIATKNVGSVL